MITRTKIKKRATKNAYYQMPSPIKRKKKGVIYSVSHISADPHKRLYFLLFFIFIFFAWIIFRLFFLQVVEWEYYAQKAFEQQYSKIVIPASRWEILASNSKTWEKQKLATNVSLDLLYIDPTYIPNKEMVAKELAPLLFKEEDYINCKKNIKLCPRGSTVSFDEGVTLEEKPISWSWEAIIKDSRTMDELIRDYADDIFRKISKIYNDFLPLKYWATEDEMNKISETSLAGIYVNKKEKMIYADPTQIPQWSISAYSKIINKILPENSTSFLKANLKKRKVQYVPLKRKISPETSEKIMELKIKSYEDSKNSVWTVPHFFKWVVLLKEHWRYYPEQELASQVIGFVDNDWIWRYWIEENFNNDLKWEDWIIFNRKNIKWEFIFFDKASINDAKDWDSIVLTIDKAIQQKAEELLRQWVIDTNADSWEIIIMDPKTWYILASVNYPWFDPNNYWEVYKISPIKEFIPPKENLDVKPKSTEDWVKLYYTKPVFVKNDNWDLIDFKADDAIKENEEIEEAHTKSWITLERKQKYMYENWFWLRNYINNNFMWIYEPGSVFKAIVIAIWLDSKEITPWTKYEEFWPIEIDTWTSEKQYIRTAEWIYRWIQTVTNAIEYSSNIWLAFVARKLWRQLFYDYLEDFNFWSLFEIDIPWEQGWTVQYWKRWNEAKLLTVSFWQWITVTPLQMVAAYSSLANWWKLIKPKLIKEIIKSNWEVIVSKPEIIKQVVTEKTSAQITSILVSSVDNWAAKTWWVKWYKVAWKTWTAQMSCDDSHRCIIWRYEAKKEGHFITSFWWYAPAQDPQFVIIVKINRARMWPKTYWSNTAAPVFSKLTEFLLQYYGIAPEES